MVSRKKKGSNQNHQQLKLTVCQFAFEGLMGPLIIHNPEEDPHVDDYDEEFEVTVSDLYVIFKLDMSAYLFN
jgi:hypothetical protein